MRKIFILFLTIILFSGISSQIQAQNDEDSTGLQELLLLLIPEETDNPNYALTFTDPTEKGVFLSIDGAEEKEIRSPYELPSLGIGDHILRVRFTDDTDTERIYEDTIVIIPRPPQIDTPTVEDNALIVTGKGLPGSKLILFLSGADRSFRESVNVSDKGDWEATIEGDFSTGVYNTVGYVSKNGYGSDLSEPVTFSLETTTPDEKVDDTTTPISFSFVSITRNNIKDVLLENRDLMILGGGVFIFALLLGVVLSRIIFFRSERKIESTFKAVLQGKKREPIKDILHLDKNISKGEDEKNEVEKQSTVQKADDAETNETSDEITPDGDSTNTPSEEVTSDETAVESSEAISDETDTIADDQTSPDTDDSTDQSDDSSDESEAEDPSETSNSDEKNDESISDGASNEVSETTSQTETPNDPTSSLPEQSADQKGEDQETQVKRSSFLDKLKSMTLMGKRSDPKEDSKMIPVGQEAPSDANNEGIGDISEPDDPGGITGLPEDLQEPASSKPTIKVSKSAGIDPYEDVEPVEEEIPVYETVADVNEAGQTESTAVETTDDSSSSSTEGDKTDDNSGAKGPDDETTDATNPDPGSGDSSDEGKVVSAKEFLEKFKTADPDPEGLDQVVPADTDTDSDSYDVEISPDVETGSGDEAEDGEGDEASTQSSQETKPSMTEKLGAVGVYTQAEEEKEKKTEKPKKRLIIEADEEEDEPTKTGTKKRPKKKTTPRSKTSIKKKKVPKKSKTSSSTRKKNEASKVNEYESKNRFQEIKTIKTKPLERIKPVKSSSSKRVSPKATTSKSKKKRNITISLTSKKK